MTGFYTALWLSQFDLIESVLMTISQFWWYCNPPSTLSCLPVMLVGFCQWKLHNCFSTSPPIAGYLPVNIERINAHAVRFFTSDVDTSQYPLRSFFQQWRSLVRLLLLPSPPKICCYLLLCVRTFVSVMWRTILIFMKTSPLKNPATSLPLIRLSCRLFCPMLKPKPSLTRFFLTRLTGSKRSSFVWFSSDYYFYSDWLHACLPGLLWFAPTSSMALNFTSCYTSDFSLSIHIHRLILNFITCPASLRISVYCSVEK